MMEPDLNLLRVFDMLMSQHSVTRAAERLNLTQSAVSHPLGRLRAMLGDPLFVRSPGGLRPTARAEEIAPGIRDGLNLLRSALSPPDFDPALANRRFTIATGTYFCELLVPKLVERLAEAPGIALRVVPVTDMLDRALDRGAVDLVLGGSVKAAARFVDRRRSDHPIVPDPAHRRRAPSRRSGSIAMVPRRQAVPAKIAGRIAILSAGEIVVPLSMLRHHKQQADAGLAWLRACLA